MYVHLLAYSYHSVTASKHMKAVICLPSHINTFRSNAVIEQLFAKIRLQPFFKIFLWVLVISEYR